MFNKPCGDSPSSDPTNIIAGVVTTTRVTHATPASLYGHSAHRTWESDIDLNEEKNTESCKDLARQLVEDKPG